jgi:hypothetical protein
LKLALTVLLRAGTIKGEIPNVKFHPINLRAKNAQHPTRYPVGRKNGGAQRSPHRPFDVQRWMFNVQTLKHMFDIKAEGDIRQ